MPRNNMPENWQPPAPAWQAKWDGENNFVVGYFGIQAETPCALSAWADIAFKSDFSPLRVERGSFLDKAGSKSFIYIGYWHASSYQKWWALESNRQWWLDPARESDGVGYFREIIAMPRDRFETLNSSTSPHGISATAQELEGPIDEHGYAGGMRDRIPLSDQYSLQNNFDTNVKLNSLSRSEGKRVIVFPPENMCVIRSGQNWSECDDEQKSAYLTKVHPTLKKGMTFLQKNPHETSCFSMRFVDTKNSEWGDMEQSFGLGYATDVYAFEEWAKSHPTHIAILDRFMDMVAAFGEKLQLKLWHEVSVLPATGCEFEYIGCHEQTGLLNYC